MPSKHWKTQRIVGRLVGLLTWYRNGLLRCHQLATQQALGQAVHQQTEDHDEAQGNHTLGLLDEHRGSQKQGIFEKTKPPLYPSLLFIRRDHLFMRKALVIQNVGGHNCKIRVGNGSVSLCVKALAYSADESMPLALRAYRHQQKPSLSP